MTMEAPVGNDEITEAVVQRIRERVGGPGAESRERLARALFADAGPDDLRDDAPDDVYGAALALWSLGAQRQRGRASVRVYTPALDEDGWSSRHTIVEVVTDDMPFLVDSVSNFLTRNHAEVLLVLHPLFLAERDASGALTELHPEAGPGARGARESWMHVRVSAQPASRHAELRDGILAVLADVRGAVEDWEEMRGLCERAAHDLEPLGERSEEAVAFLRWLLADHYTFLGYRIYDFEGDRAFVRQGSGRGVLRDALASVFDGMLTGGRRPAELDRPDLVRLTKSNRRSSVHRGVHMDAIGVKRFDASGEVVGEHLFVGLFTSLAYSEGARQIPIVRRKVAEVLRRTSYHPASHNHKTLVHILETYPRDELFQIDVDDLERIARGVLTLQERQRVALFVRLDPFGRFASCLVYVPRDRYDTPLRHRFQEILESAFDGHVSAFYTLLTDSPLARLHFIVATTPGRVPEFDRRRIEASMVEAARSWDDALRDALVEERGEQRGLLTYERFRGTFPRAYADAFPVAVAVHDAERIEEALESGDAALNLYRPIEAPPHEVRFKLYVHGDATRLSDVLPMLENMGLRALHEVPYRVQPQGAPGPVWIRDVALESQDGRAIDLGRVRDRFHEAFRAVWRGEMESDGFNRLVLRAGLSGREVTVLRACCKFLRQARTPFSQEYMEQTLADHPELARLLVEVFVARFDPEHREGAEERADAAVAGVRRALDQISNLDEDRILRAFLTVIDATVRTNYFQRGDDGRPKRYLALKLDSQRIPDLPRPRPLREVFVYSPRVEAVHLRGGMVARGGIRWSDRREDFRTEVLGLMKAQMVKNTVIVPVGSKGGFVVKQPPADRAALRDEVVACYRTLMSGLLDVTDNLDGGRVVPPPAVVRRDGDDAYLVVAADKGTATFSDIANGVSGEYGFWLDDAFASGGSAGYDHKKMGITARGAWESVRRHFREIGVDVQTTDFTVAGVGDMAGDVFGNGMLLSPHIRLVAAFNHMHVFLDPDPDPARSFAERKRLFELPTSTWADYDTSALSAGGGVHPRSAKSIPLSEPVRRLLGVDAEALPPNDVIRAILRLDVDLLWLGGIGTYVRSSRETDADAGDRSNDALRVDATELRAKVIGEGANLGLTQRARIEYALRGGRLNTDFIDNSAGVDCSDHEVNLKILLGEVERAGDITRKQRNELLVDMTEDVAALVLRDNYLQTQCLTVTQQMGARLLQRIGRAMREMERQNRLDRKLEFLPDDDELRDRAQRGLGLTRPELAILLSYTKMVLYDELLASSVPADPCLDADLDSYFPAPVRARFPEAIRRHRLRREIAATVVTNEIVNRVGITFVHEVREKCGLPAADIARAYVAARDVLRIRAAWRAIEAQDGAMPAQLQATLLAECGRLHERVTVWFLRAAGQGLDVAEQVRRYEPGVREFRHALREVLAPDQLHELVARAESWIAAGASRDLAEAIASFAYLAPALDVVRLAQRTGLSVPAMARTYFAVGARFGFTWLRHAALQLPSESSWDKRAVTALVEELDAQQADIAAAVVERAHPAGAAPAASGAAPVAPADEPLGVIEAWAATRGPLVARVDELLGELQAQPAPDLAMLAVASRQLKTLSA